VTPTTIGARRYARALLDVAQQRGDPAAVRKALEDAAATLAGQPDLRAALTHPAVSAERKRAVASAVWGSRGFEPLVLRLIEVLVDRGRAGLLPAIAGAYATLWNARRGVVAAQVVTAVDLGPEEQRGLRRAVSRATGREVELTAAVDPGVLGGVLLRMEGRVFDGTVAGRLRALRERLAGGPRA
jgi:F-type H+-transporting ATPase subunit delta